MGHTYHHNIYHLVWSTFEREPLILPELKSSVFKYLAKSFIIADCYPIEIGGMPDHIHALVGIPPKYAVSQIIRDVKICSSKWCSTNLPNKSKFSWQEGFGSFSVSASQISTVKSYILNQEKHHKTQTFKDEFIKFLQLHEVKFDERYLWR